MLVMELLENVPGLGSVGDLVIAERGLSARVGQFVLLQVGDGYTFRPWDGLSEYDAVVRSVIA